MVRFHFIIIGRVQGVGFRYFAQQHAENFNIRGWVRNKGDGKVEIDAEGEEANMERFVDAISEGPVAAQVERVDTEKVEDIHGYTSFSVRHSVGI